MTYVTDDMRALVGVKGEKRTAPFPITEELLRRFNQAVMEENPVHWDPTVAAASKYGEVVATPLFPLHASRRPQGTPDPFDRFADDPELDGTLSEGSPFGLQPIDLPFKRLLNGGTEAEFFQLARIGDVISTQSEYVEFLDKQARDGSPMVIVRIATTYTNQDDDVLAVITVSTIRR